MKVTPVQPQSTVTMNTTGKPKLDRNMYAWWKEKNQEKAGNGLLSTAAFLKESQNWRFRQATTYARLYGNQSLFSFVGTNTSKLDGLTGLPPDRPTFNIIQSCVDTLVSRITQNRPSPVFLTDNSDYKKRTLAKKLNNFILGEFHQTKAYEKATQAFRDALIEGTGCLKVYETDDDKVGIDRVLLTELLVDPNESVYGDPRQLYQIKLVDREVLAAMSPDAKTEVQTADRAYVDNSSDSSKTVSDLVMVVEGWRLPSKPGAKDGRHMIACSSGVIFDEKWEKDKFPFLFIHYSQRMLGFWAQGLAEQLMGTQVEINSLLYTISKAIKLVGVPRVFVEAGSKVVKAHFNNEVGSIVTFQGTKPQYEVAPCVPAELYEQLQRLINFGYQQSGVSSLEAAAQKPAGLNSGEAIRSYDDISTDRFALTSRRYDNIFIDLAYLVVDTAKDIAKRTGKYKTVYPNKNGTREIDLPMEDIEGDPFVIQCFNMSSLPKDPAGRMAKVTEMIQGGMVTIKEGRRLLDFPDLEQVEKLANASEERIFQYLDAIVEDGEYNAPDPFMDLDLAAELATQYYNLYVSAKLEEDRAQMLRDFFTQANGIKNQAAQAMQQQAAAQQPQPQAAPQAVPSSPLVPNGNPAGAMAS